MPSQYGPKVIAFYHSPAWKRCSSSFLASKNYLCERCGKYIPGKMIVHHKIHLNEENVSDPSISLSWSNLECLCIDCHNKEHFGSGDGESHHDVTFNPDGSLVIKDKKGGFP